MSLGGSSAELERVLGDLPIPGYICDQEGLITYYNPPAAVLWGRAPGLRDPGIRFCGSVRLFDAEGQPLEPPASCVGQAIGQRRPQVGRELIIERADGARSRVLAHASPIFAGDQVRGAVCVMTELPRNAFSEGAFQDAFEWIFDRSEDGVLYARTDGTILRANRAACAALGLTQGELRALGREGILVDGRSGEELAAARERHGLLKLETHLRRKDGTLIPVELTSIVVTRRQDAGNVLVVFRDLTTRREAERLQQVSQKMEAVSQLASGIAHNFNNLLLVISASCAQVESVAGATLSEDITAVKDAIRQASDLTRRLLTLGSRQISTTTRFALDGEVASMVAMLRNAIRADIEIEERLGARDATIEFDRAELEQILLNLAVNARDAMPGGGKLSISTREVRLDHAAATALGLRAGAHVLLEVADTGQGIAPAELPRVFDPFFTTKGEGGFGLGLSTVYGIVQRSGGRITVSSVPGAGTQFLIHLPSAPAEAPAAAAGEGPQLAAGVKTVLVVDDMELVRRSVARILTTYGFQVIEAQDGKEALAVIQDGRPVDLVLSDVIMPVMGGVELAERMAAIIPALPMILMSGYASGERIESARRRGVRFLQKPFPRDALLREITELLREAATGPRRRPA